MSKRIGLIGAGNMGTAIVRGLVAAQVIAPEDITALDVEETQLEKVAADPGVNTTTDLEVLASASDAIVLAVKPQSMEGLLHDLARHVGASHLIISIAAGISTSFMEKRLGDEVRVVRVMPNTPAMVRAGATALCRGSRATDEDMELAVHLFSALGTTLVVDEVQMDAVTAVSGSGPAYFFYLVEKITKAGIEQGLSEKEASELARQTLYGAGKLLRETGVAPEELRARVTSKGGTTAAAVAIFDKADLGGIVCKAVSAAAARSKELGK
jgi:pyrroline-5-carboxylate reductase